MASKNSMFMSDETVLEIYRRAWAGDGVRALAREFGCAPTWVSQIKLGAAKSELTGQSRIITERGGEGHPTAKLKNKQALEIYERSWNGENQRKLAAEFGVNIKTVVDIKSGRKWSSVTGHCR